MPLNKKYGKEISIEQLPARLPASQKMFTKIDQLTKLSDINTDVPTGQRTAQYVIEPTIAAGKQGPSKHDGSSQNFAILDGNAELV